MAAKLRLTLFSTNPIEPALSVVEDNAAVKKWQGGDMKLRWVAKEFIQKYDHLVKETEGEIAIGEFCPER